MVIEVEKLLKRTPTETPYLNLRVLIHLEVNEGTFLSVNIFVRHFRPFHLLLPIPFNRGVVFRRTRTLVCCCESLCRSLIPTSFYGGHIKNSVNYYFHIYFVFTETRMNLELVYSLKKEITKNYQISKKFCVKNGSMTND